MMKEKTVIVTGGAGLLGRTFVRAIAEQGGIVLIADIDIDAANLFAEELSISYGERVSAIALDINSKVSVSGLIKQTCERYGRIDAVVNNAYPRNKNYGRKLEDVSYEDFCENINLHLGGYFLVAQQFSIFFQKQGYGNIVNLASIYGSIAPRFGLYTGTKMTMPVEYAAIKSAVIQLTRYFAQYYKSNGIKINCLSPGGIYDKQPESFSHAYNEYCGQNGMLDPNDITGALLFLLSDASNYMTGQNLIVDDGFTL